MNPNFPFQKLFVARITFFGLSIAGLITGIMGLFVENSACVFIGLPVSLLALTGAVMVRGRCASCHALLPDADGQEKLCSCCESTLQRCLPRL